MTVLSFSVTLLLLLLLLTALRRCWEGPARSSYVRPPWGGAAFDFSVMSYNILSQELLQDNAYLYQHCDPRVLPWDHRLPNLLAEIQHHDADVSASRLERLFWGHFPAVLCCKRCICNNLMIKIFVLLDPLSPGSPRGPLWKPDQTGSTDTGYCVCVCVCVCVGMFALFSVYMCVYQVTSVSTRSEQEVNQMAVRLSSNPPVSRSCRPIPLSFSALATPFWTVTMWDWFCCCSLMTWRPLCIGRPPSASPTPICSTTLAAATSNWHSWPSYWLRSADCPASPMAPPARWCCVGTWTRPPWARSTVSWPPAASTTADWRWAWSECGSSSSSSTNPSADWTDSFLRLQVSGQETSPRGQRLLPCPIWSHSLGIDHRCEYRDRGAAASSSSPPASPSEPPPGDLTQLIPPLRSCWHLSENTLFLHRPRSHFWAQRRRSRKQSCV